MTNYQRVIRLFNWGVKMYDLSGFDHKGFDIQTAKFLLDFPANIPKDISLLMLSYYDS
ncbi:MAG: hypothetical protein Hyperionvirus5_15 [Hyperionvirus sp.]|uniref:Uncharacterized protein n=1 Tax=Hyperionvirus sp. TaxID=2487770 RepID=A0A3G5ACX8_9VIRU|nr:MAG: hypothetical protein Hyperionvirus5_15 [Hyperionvirus sp.]